MKFCLRSRVSPLYLSQVDQIRVDYRDRETIPDLYYKYKKTIILFPALDNEIYDWNQLLQFDIACEHNLIISVLDSNIGLIAKAKNLKFMLAFPANSGWELEMMENIGAEYAYVGIPLFFNLPKITTQYKIKLRTIPTISYNHHYPFSSGVCGQWIRPEDLEKYDNYIDVVEFEFCSITREETLYRTYGINKKWDTRIDILIEDIDSSALNRLIPEELVEARMNCQQKCKNGGTCRLCETILKSTEEKFMHKIAEIVKK